MKPLVFAVCLGALLVPASAALAEPARDETLRLVGRTDEMVYFVPARGDEPRIWMLSAEIVPQMIDDTRVIGSWMELEMDCAGRSLNVREIAVLDEAFGVPYRESTNRKIDPEPGTIYGIVFDHVCKGGPLDRDVTRDFTLDDAVRAAQEQKAGREGEFHT